MTTRTAFTCTSAKRYTAQRPPSVDDAWIDAMPMQDYGEQVAWMCRAQAYMRSLRGERVSALLVAARRVVDTYTAKLDDNTTIDRHRARITEAICDLAKVVKDFPDA